MPPQGRNVWAEHYDREMNDILALQDEVSLAIVGAMYPELERFESEPTLSGGSARGGATGVGRYCNPIRV